MSFFFPLPFPIYKPSLFPAQVLLMAFKGPRGTYGPQRALATAEILSGLFFAYKIDNV